ncbi:hypothetical protein P691DRAFT_789891 [Macrolepiota fuliginosa MF-IS2]|uniref:Uncharacterized protein n=1 Tax=Macrolepiota fuliginosa MF-IS2 TaxID=1400762 RepID=A0A9P5X3J3_9AGAR|nr:hypothetical protein P691DRAFT_789891 [Macrolepiota fuliginosa MF-IS2]
MPFTYTPPPAVPALSGGLYGLTSGRNSDPALEPDATEFGAKNPALTKPSPFRNGAEFGVDEDRDVEDVGEYDELLFGTTSRWFSGTEGNASKSSESSNDELKLEPVEDAKTQDPRRIGWTTGDAMGRSLKESEKDISSVFGGSRGSEGDDCCKVPDLSDVVLGGGWRRISVSSDPSRGWTIFASQQKIQHGTHLLEELWTPSTLAPLFVRSLCCTLPANIAALAIPENSPSPPSGPSSVAKPTATPAQPQPPRTQKPRPEASQQWVPSPPSDDANTLFLVCPYPCPLCNKNDDFDARRRKLGNLDLRDLDVRPGEGAAVVNVAVDPNFSRTPSTYIDAGATAPFALASEFLNFPQRPLILLCFVPRRSTDFNPVGAFDDSLTYLIVNTIGNDNENTGFIGEPPPPEDLFKEDGALQEIRGVCGARLGGTANTLEDDVAVLDMGTIANTVGRIVTNAWSASSRTSSLSLVGDIEAYARGWAELNHACGADENWLLSRWKGDLWDIECSWRRRYSRSLNSINSPSSSFSWRRPNFNPPSLLHSGTSSLAPNTPSATPGSSPLTTTSEDGRPSLSADGDQVNMTPPKDKVGGSPFLTTGSGFGSSSWHSCNTSANDVAEDTRHPETEIRLGSDEIAITARRH